MTFEIEVAGRVRTVSVERAGAPGRFRITLDGVPRNVDVVRSGDTGVTLLRTAPPEERTVPSAAAAGTAHGTVPLSVTPGSSSGEVFVYLQGRMAAVRVNGRRGARGADASVETAGEVSIVAPMPGRIVRMLAEPGEEVAARQGVVVMEAMKMENELRAPRAGRLKEIGVAPGMSVEAGRVLAVIE